MQQDTKTCSTCKEEKPLAEFGKNSRRVDGLQTWCKSCKRDDDRIAQARYRRSEKGKAYISQYRESGKAKAAFDRYRKTDKGKACANRASAIQRLKCPDRIKAGNAVNHAIRDGRLPRPTSSTCAYLCGRQAEMYHHNFGYSAKHALDVVPVCRKCDREWHQSKKLAIGA